MSNISYVSYAVYAFKQDHKKAGMRVLPLVSGPDFAGMSAWDHQVKMIDETDMKPEARVQMVAELRLIKEKTMMALEKEWVENDADDEKVKGAISRLNLASVRLEGREVRAWLNFLVVKERWEDAMAYLESLEEEEVKKEAAAENGFGSALQLLLGKKGREEMSLLSLIMLATRLKEAGVEGCSEDGKTVARCALQLDKTLEWMTGGEVDVGRWKGVTAEGGRVTKIDWGGLGMKGVVTVAFGKLRKLEELCLLEQDYAFAVPEGLQGLRERLGSGWKVGVGVHDGSEEQFDGWEGVTEAVVEVGVKEVGWSAFNACKNLTRACVGEGVEKIDMFAFNRCQKLAEVTIARSVKKVNNDAFHGTALKVVRISKSAQYESRSFPEGCEVVFYED